MPTYSAVPSGIVSVNVAIPNETVIPVLQFPLANTLPAGSFRIGGDSPNGLILFGVSPVSRILDLFDSATNLHVARTTSSALDGTYEFRDILDRNYFVICRGESGERDQIWSDLSPVPI